MISAIILVGLSTKAQNANQSGLFFEGGAGLVFGDRPISNLDERGSNWMDDIFQEVETSTIGFTIDTYRKSKVTYGFGFNVAAGYRWSVSRAFAIDLKAKFQDATYRFGESAIGNVIVGGRYYTPEFGGNKSIYINVGTGCGFFIDKGKVALPYEIGIGFNINNHLNLGLSWDAQYSFADKYIYGKHFGIACIKLGFRI